MIEYVLFGSLKDGIEVTLYFRDSTATKMSFADNCREIFPFLSNIVYKSMVPMVYFVFCPWSFELDPRG